VKKFEPLSVLSKADRTFVTRFFSIVSEWSPLFDLSPLFEAFGLFDHVVDLDRLLSAGEVFLPVPSLCEESLLPLSGVLDTLLADRFS